MFALARHGGGSRVVAPIFPLDREPSCSAENACPCEVALDMPKVHSGATLSAWVSDLQGSARSFPCHGGRGPHTTPGKGITSNPKLPGALSP